MLLLTVVLDLFDSSDIDKVCILYVYMPMIREQIHDFVMAWNIHPIRRQKGRPYLIPGVPTMLYRGIFDKAPPQLVEPNVGWDVNEKQMTKLQEMVAPYDLDRYLPEATLQCCHRYLEEEAPGQDYPIKFTDGHSVLYTKLRRRLRHHEETKLLPAIEVVPSTVGNLAWIKRVRATLGLEGNELDDGFDQNTDGESSAA